MKVVEINAANFLSTGNIMMQIAENARKQDIDVYTFSKYTKTAVEYGKRANHKNHYFIGSRFENTLHRYFSWITDFQDYGTVFGTLKLIKQIKEIDPDIIHLHDIVGWYINIDILFNFLKKANKPIVWTTHCCWAYTGRCIYYNVHGCDKWKHECGECPTLREYPRTYF